MPEKIAIASVDHIDGDILLVELSDGSSITLTLEEMLAIRHIHPVSPEDEKA